MKQNWCVCNFIFVKMFQAKRKMVKLVEEIIEGRRKKKKIKSEKWSNNHNNNKNGVGIINDVVDVLLNDGSQQVTDEVIAHNMIDMMIPGQDSVPILITLAIKYLSDSPSALQQLTVPSSYSLSLSLLPILMSVFELTAQI